MVDALTSLKYVAAETVYFLSRSVLVYLEIRRVPEHIKENAPFAEKPFV